MRNISLPVLAETTIVNGAESDPSGSEAGDTTEEGGADGEV